MPMTRPVFVDTSAILGALVVTDAFHDQALKIFSALQTDEAALITSSYVLHETVSLLQARGGIPLVRAAVERAFPLLDTVWIDRATHERAMASLLAADRRRISLTDWTSFEIMRDHGIEEAFTCDRDFEAQGFRLAAP